MNNEPNKPIPAQELTEKELEGISGGATAMTKMAEVEMWLPAFTSIEWNTVQVQNVEDRAGSLIR